MAGANVGDAPIPEISKMHQPRPNINLRQYAIAAVVAVVASFAFYYVFDVMPRSFRSDDSGLTEAEIKSELEQSLQQIAGYENAGATEVKFDGYVISWQQTFDKSACDDPNAYYSRTVTIDLRNIETRPDRVRVRRYDSRGWVMLIWEYEENYEELLQRMNDKQK
jgi:hypothetical protein